MATPHHRGAAWVVPTVAAAGLAVAAILFIVSRAGFQVAESLGFFMPAVAATASLLALPFTKKRFTYYAAQACGAVCYCLSIPGSSGSPSAQTVLLVVFVVDLVLSEPYPLNLVESVALATVASALQSLTAGSAAGLPVVVEHAVRFAVPGEALAVFGSLMTRHREQVVDLLSSREKLTRAVVELARSNTLYQDYAVLAHEKATELERQRMTRDIHDIVGYALTNNMMLMEAALDLMKENPLALPAIIETARSNAQEGLERVRSALYLLREQGAPSPPVGLNAVARLARIFEQATHIQIRCDFSNAPQGISNEVDSTLYHLVQESLVNSFRHGNATEAWVRFRYASGVVYASVQDNGVGCAHMVEGIGLRGMRERIEHVGGELRADNFANGFLVSASIPMESFGNDRQASNPDR